VLVHWLGDLLSPPSCAGCDSPTPSGRVAFCGACAATIERCREDGDPRAFGLFGGALATAIKKLKYGGRPDLARPLGHLLRQAWRKEPLAPPPSEIDRQFDFIIPVPLHPVRLAHRGFNQSALLATHLARELRVPWRNDHLRRTVDTPPQASLDRTARQANVEGVFLVPASRGVRGRAILLVDDVSTTGATLKACRKALLDAGANRVGSTALARTLD
jgi:ComF family protein